MMQESFRLEYFYEKRKINELPQLLNILFGHMSIVGPRPLVPSGEANYTPSQAIIIRSVRPGVTGIGSLMLRDEESFYAHRSDAQDFYRNEISPYKASLEIWYVENQSFLVRYTNNRFDSSSNLISQSQGRKNVFFFATDANFNVRFKTIKVLR